MNAVNNRKWVSATTSKRALAGGAVAGLLAVLVNSPEAREWAMRLAFQWGPGLFLGGALLYMAHVHAPRFVAAQTETALALQHLARAVEQLVERDSAFQREQDVLLNHVARRVEALFPVLGQLERQLNGVASGKRSRAAVRSRPRHRRRTGRTHTGAETSLD